MSTVPENSAVRETPKATVIGGNFFTEDTTPLAPLNIVNMDNSIPTFADTVAPDANESAVRDGVIALNAAVDTLAAQVLTVATQLNALCTQLREQHSIL